ncbi:hypothetical protein H5410_006342 [Solanum commersonii]|uniref:non-specific serine/threonine protein kinase n=1 Tax=Solanum commersonii TaxID=4109 RepID=A0A9J6AA08_SOLCO|nr:hypothetical protein H5410_006342 [Solanum commersonii]
MYVYRVETITKRSIQNRLNVNTFDDFARWQEGEIGMQQLEFNYEDWISKLDALSIWMYNFGDQHFSSTIEQKISDIEHQIGLCIKVLESIPQVVRIHAEKRELNHERAMFECLKGRFYNAILVVYKKEAECHLLKATQLDPLMWDAWNCLGCCVAKKGNYQEAKEYYQTALKMFFCLFDIINWRACLKFLKEPKVSDAAKNLICRLLCDVESRLGTRGVEEIKAHPWFEGTKWDALYEMKVAYKPIVTRELDTQNFEKFTKEMNVVKWDEHKSCSVFQE